MKKTLLSLLMMGAFAIPSIGHSAPPSAGNLESGPYTVTGTMTTPTPCIVDAGSKVLFVASNAIILSPGFETKVGSNFRAMIGDHPSITTSSDSDTDSLADWWELLFFGSLSLGGEDDFDGDGVMNKYESQLGTSPSDTNDRPTSIIQYDSYGRIIRSTKFK